MIDKDRITEALRLDFPLNVDFERALMVAERVFSRMRGRMDAELTDPYVMSWLHQPSAMKILMIGIAQEALVEAQRVKDESLATSMRESIGRIGR